MQSLLRAIAILEYMRNADKACSVAELVELSDLPPSTVHRILQTFCMRNYIVRNEHTHLYHLGPALIALGSAATKRLNLRDAAHPVLKKLMQATGEDAFLVISAGFNGIVLDVVEGPNNLRVVERYGSDVDMHCGAIRKSLLAFQSDDYIEKYIAHGLAQHTQSTIINPDELRGSLAKIRRDGVAVSQGEYIEDAVGVGAPVFDINKKIIASVGIIVPVMRTSKDMISLFMQEVKKYAKELSLLMGCPVN